MPTGRLMGNGRKLERPPVPLRLRRNRATALAVPRRQHVDGLRAGSSLCFGPLSNCERTVHRGMSLGLKRHPAVLLLGNSSDPALAGFGFPKGVRRKANRRAARMFSGHGDQDSRAARPPRHFFFQAGLSSRKQVDASLGRPPRLASLPPSDLQVDTSPDARR